MQQTGRSGSEGGSAPPACKCCGGASEHFGRVDAARSCEDPRGAPFPPAGREILYWRCTACDFVFTTDFDPLSDAEMGAEIYNADYFRADPEFAEIRPTYFAKIFAKALAPVRSGLLVVDYGGGSGRFAELMRAAGFEAHTVDPYFFRQEAALNSADLVTAFEVFEHSRTPRETFREAAGLLRSGGVLLFSTQLRPRAAGIAFPYIAPRNGHVSIHSEGSLDACAADLGMVRLPLEKGLHLFVPARGRVVEVGLLLLRQRAGAILFAASREGPRAFLRNWGILARHVGAARWQALLDPRHPLRLLRMALSGGRS